MILSATIMSCPLFHLNSNWPANQSVWWWSQERIDRPVTQTPMEICLEEFVLLFAPLSPGSAHILISKESCIRRIDVLSAPQVKI